MHLMGLPVCLSFSRARVTRLSRGGGCEVAVVHLCLFLSSTLLRHMIAVPSRAYLFVRRISFRFQCTTHDVHRLSVGARNLRRGVAPEIAPDKGLTRIVENVDLITL